MSSIAEIIKTVAKHETEIYLSEDDIANILSFSLFKYFKDSKSYRGIFKTIKKRNCIIIINKMKKESYVNIINLKKGLSCMLTITDKKLKCNYYTEYNEKEEINEKNKI